MKEAAVEGADLCLLLCNVDHFKRVNDAWGHLVGDHVLRWIANTLRLNLGPDVLAARYGGEEFALIMPATDLAEARLAANSAREGIRAKRLTRRSTGESIGNVTMSIGVGRYRPNEDPDDFIGRADACLYASKRLAPDRITSEAELT